MNKDSRQDERPEPDSPTTGVSKPVRTAVENYRYRIFLHQPFGERIRSFWWAVTWQMIFRWTPRRFIAWRCLLLRLFGARIGHGCFVAPSVYIVFPWNLSLADGVVVEHKAIMNCMGKIYIGVGARISQHAHLCTETHDYVRSDMRTRSSSISIGSDVWIAADAFVGPGVSIGNGSVLAARSSAFKDLPAHQVCVGEPARPLKPRDSASNRSDRMARVSS